MLSLTSLATNGLNSVAQFRTPQLERSALDSAMSTAIYQQRSRGHAIIDYVTGATSCARRKCRFQEPGMSSVGYVSNLVYHIPGHRSSSETRTVTFIACLPYNYTGAICPSPLLVAKVDFDDYTVHRFPITRILLVTGSYCTHVLRYRWRRFPVGSAVSRCSDSDPLRST